ncbi:17842_t:CDS:2 [Rhizophagus irregularis]|nr:17842_t:CDS:2 [Rhizophagus irregularis]
MRRKNGKLGGKAIELEGPEDAQIMKPNHKLLKKSIEKKTLPISDDQLAEWSLLRKEWEEANSENLLEKKVNEFNTLNAADGLCKTAHLDESDNNKSKVNIKNDYTWEYLVFWRNTNQLADWLALNVNRSYRVKITDVEIDWKASINIIMKEFQGDVSSLNNDLTAYNLKNYLEILPTFTMLNQRNLELYESKKDPTIKQIINEAFDKLKDKLDENNFRIPFNYHAKLLQILDDRSFLILMEEFFMKQLKGVSKPKSSVQRSSGSKIKLVSMSHLQLTATLGTVKVIKKEGFALLEGAINNFCEEIGNLEHNLTINNLCKDMGNLENHLRNTYETMEEQNELSSIKWRLVDSGIDLKKNNIELTQEEQECINNLKNLLNDVETSTNDLKLLQQVMDKSNVKFQSNNQTLEEANMRLYDPVPKDSQVYKPPLQKTLGAISKWHKSTSKT